MELHGGEGEEEVRGQGEQRIHCLHPLSLCKIAMSVHNVRVIITIIIGIREYNFWFVHIQY
jgi:hypothetical protein